MFSTISHDIFFLLLGGSTKTLLMMVLLVRSYRLNPGQILLQARQRLVQHLDNRRSQRQRHAAAVDSLQAAGGGSHIVVVSADG